MCLAAAVMQTLRTLHYVNTYLLSILWQQMYCPCASCSGQLVYLLTQTFNHRFLIFNVCILPSLCLLSLYASQLRRICAHTSTLKSLLHYWQKRSCHIWPVSYRPPDWDSCFKPQACIYEEYLCRKFKSSHSHQVRWTWNTILQFSFHFTSLEYSSTV